MAMYERDEDGDVYELKQDKQCIFRSLGAKGNVKYVYATL
jgi:hypothetical protein